jgi:hypothetical protein
MKPIHHSLFFAVHISIFALPVTAIAQNANFTSTFLTTGTFNVSPALSGTANSNPGGTRMLWYPRKAAFRAGSASAAQWTDSFIGNYSVALGQNTTASGANSTAFGNGTSASQPNSTAFGVNSVASGAQSTAFGNGTMAPGDSSTSIGIGTKSGSYASTAMGRWNTGLGSPISWIASDPLFEIGNGVSSTAPSNALTVFKNGNMQLQGNLTLGGTITSANSPVLTSATAAGYGFVQATGGIINLPSTTAGISASSGSIFSLDTSGKVNYAANRPISIASTTPSSSSATGALTVAGGIGVSLDSWFNGVRVGRGNGSISSNTALGENALSANLTASSNTAIGKSALALNTSGSSNTSIGTDALAVNATGSTNTAVGAQALRSNQSASNTAVGASALRSNTSGNSNTSIGSDASFSNTSGIHNVAIGSIALYANTTGSSNIAIGNSAGRYQANGLTTLTAPNNSIYIGKDSRGFNNSDNNSIVIGANAIGLGANTTVIGNTLTTRTHLHGQTTTDSLKVTGQVILDQPQGDISMGIYQ